MRQRNDGDQPLTVHTDPPQVVNPGETVDHDTYIVGLTVVDEPESKPDPAPDDGDSRTVKAKPTKEATK